MAAGTVADVDAPSDSRPPAAPRPRLVTPIIIVVGAVLLDQSTKWWAVDALGDGDVIEVLPTLEFDLTYNRGFSFGTGAGFGHWIGLLVIALCLFLVHQIRVSSSLMRANIAAVVLGGALGNLVDRIFRADDGALSGEVIDFIDVTWYAVFNVADIFVVCGCIVFAWHEVKSARRELPAEADDSTPSAPEDEPAA